MSRKIKLNYLFNSTILILIFCSFLLFIGKWIFSYYFFDNQIGIRVILENPSDGYFYFPYIKYLSSLDFNISFDPNIENLKNISIPLYGILVHTIFFKVFGNYSFIILEFFCIFTFLIIFYYIFRKFNFSKLISLTLVIFLFITPSLFDFLGLDSIPYLSKINNLYNLRFQNPLVVSLFFYIFILFLIKLNDEEIYKFKNFVLIGSILAFSFTSFYYHFVIEVISISLFIIYKANSKIKNIFLGKTKYYLTSLLVFLILSFPFLLNLYSVEPNYSERLCLVDLTWPRKMILLNHLFNGIIKVQFLLIFFLISFLTYFTNKKRFAHYQLNNIFYIIFLSSIFAPFLFVFASPKTCLVYHFNNIIFQAAFLCLLFLFLNLCKNYFKMHSFSENLKKVTSCGFIVFFIVFYNFKVFQDQKYNYEKEDYRNYRNSLNSVISEIKKLKNESQHNLSVLTMDPHLMVWSIMNDIKDIRLISGQIVPKTNDMIENDLISAFKFMNKNEDDFIKFFENKKTSWRYHNVNSQLFFWFRYSANSLKTYNDSRDFDKSTLNFILKTSPLYAQSFAIPNNEFKRLKSKFINFNEVDYKKPDIIYINNSSFLFDNLSILNKNYCKYKVYKKFVFYKLKNKTKKCQKIDN